MSLPTIYCFLQLQPPLFKPLTIEDELHSMLIIFKTELNPKQTTAHLHCCCRQRQTCDVPTRLASTHDC